MHLKPIVAAVLVLVASVGAGAVAAAADGSEQGANAYSGTHVEFAASGDGIADYSVGGTEVVDAVAVQSQSETESRTAAEGGLDADASLDAVTGFAAADVDVTASTETQATVESESGATIEAHDNERGVLVVDAGAESQYVEVNLTSDAEAESESDKRVVVTKEDGTEAVVMVVGDGEVTVNERGNVSASLGDNAKLVYRQYAEGRSDSEATQEELVTSGEAAAEVYYQQPRTAPARSSTW